MSEGDADMAWITWNGGECPKGLTVDARLRDGYLFKGELSETFCAVNIGEECSPELCNWQQSGGDLDIVAYREVQHE